MYKFTGSEKLKTFNEHNKEMDHTKDDLSDSGIGTTPRNKNPERTNDTIVEMKGLNYI